MWRQLDRLGQFFPPKRGVILATKEVPSKKWDPTSKRRLIFLFSFSSRFPLISDIALGTSSFSSQRVKVNKKLESVEMVFDRQSTTSFSRDLLIQRRGKKEGMNRW